MAVQTVITFPSLLADQLRTIIDLLCSVTIRHAKLCKPLEKRHIHVLLHLVTILQLFKYPVLTFQKFLQTICPKQNIMKKILLLAALLIGGVSAAWAADHQVTVANFQFTPRLVNVAVGDTITWVWSNGMHTTTAVSIPAGARRWNKPIDTSHTQFRMPITVAGTYNYRCNFHFAEGMIGRIVVSGTSPGQAPATN